MVRDDKANLKAGVILLWFAASLVALAGGAAVLSALAENSFPLPPSDVEGYLLSFIFVVFILAGAMLSLHLKRWEPVNYRRQMAAAWGFAARVPLAQPHPLPNVGALPLPMTIKLKTNWPQALVFWFLLAGGVFLLESSIFLLEGVGLLASMQHLLQLPNLLGQFIVPLLYCTPLMIQVTSPQHIEVTPEWLLVHHRKPWLSSKSRTQWVRWSDARLFAIRSGKPGTPATRYELSSPYAVVTWKRIRRPHWWSLHRPAIPFAEYNAQMEALIALISGLTGLPLYDVR